jgi:hypothetical protein
MQGVIFACLQVRFPLRIKYLFVFALLSAAFLLRPVEARVGHDCADCHTMHNSQNADSVDGAGPHRSLLASSCVGCHSSTSSETIKTIGGNRVPVVYNTVEPAQPLAGGNFYWVAQGASYDSFGHNVGGVTNPDSRLSTAPGGTDGHGGGSGNPNTCSLQDKDGVLGACHAAIPSCRGCHVPRHHAVDKADQAHYALVTDGGYYRFLGQIADTVIGGGHQPTGFVKGGEDPNWEHDPDATHHNEYAGETAYQPGTTYRSISQRGCGCHTAFLRFSRGECLTCHDSMGGAPEYGRNGEFVTSGGRWVRHPNDTALPGAGTEYAGYTTYDPEVPICRPDIDGFSAASSAVRPGTDLVSCLSCHRAHGSPYRAMLRWQYQPGADIGPTGTCRTCHTAK